MRNVTETTMLVRESVELPASLNPVTRPFQEGWRFLGKVDGERLEKRILKCKWNLFKIADGSRRSGVGDTSQIAIASALKLTLRSVNQYFNCARVGSVQLTVYPWFTLARVLVYPFRIQEGPVLPIPDQAVPSAIVLERKDRSYRSNGLFPLCGNAMPLLKDMLVSSVRSEARIQ